MPKIKPDQIPAVVKDLKSLLLFARCTEPQLTAIAGAMETLDCPKGKVLIMEQEISRMLYVLLKGSVGIWKRMGGEKKSVSTLSAPNFFGENSMFVQVPATAQVKAEDECKMLTLSLASFEALVKQDASLTELIKKNMELVKSLRPAPEATPPKQD